MKGIRNLAYALGLCVLASCGDDGGATAKVNFINALAGRAALEESSLRPLIQDLERLVSRDTPTVFGMKLIAAYVTEDINADQSNKGVTSMIYLNNDCEEDIMHCDISAGTAEDGAPMGKIITSYFNFAQPSSQVNADLNAQARTITAGTYKYARIEFCKFNSGNAENIQWADGTVVATGTPKAFKRNACTVNSVEINPPLEAKVGSSITINLSYDYSNAITTGGGATGDDCETNVTQACFTLPEFTPSAS